MIEPTLFRQALGSFVTGVTIVTARDAAGKPVGLTANSFNSVSLNPPMVLWSLALNSQHLSIFREATAWAIHILTADQVDLSQRFASKGADKFAGLDYLDEPSGVPLLDGCAARFLCRAAFEYEGGDHAIFVGEVIDFLVAPAAPLVFHSGRYSQMMPQGERPALPADADQSEFGRYFTGHFLGLAFNAAFDDIRREYRRLGLRGSDYTVLVSLGLGGDATEEELAVRAHSGGVTFKSAAVNRLLKLGALRKKENRLKLTPAGNELLTVLLATAETTQQKLDKRLSASEMALLHNLLEKIAIEPEGTAKTRDNST